MVPLLQRSLDVFQVVEWVLSVGLAAKRHSDGGVVSLSCLCRSSFHHHLTLVLLL